MVSELQLLLFRDRLPLFPVRRERFDERFRELGDLPSPELGHFGDLRHRHWISPRDGFEAIARAEDAGVELQALGRGIARRLECAHPRIELGIAVPTRGAWELGKLHLGNGERTGDGVEQLVSALLEDGARHPLHFAQRLSRPRLRACDVEHLFVS